MKILILYYSRHGSVRALARHIAGGVERVDGCEAVLRTVPPVTVVGHGGGHRHDDGDSNSDSNSDGDGDGDAFAELSDLETCDGLIIGSPTRFGTAAAPLKHFLEQTTSQWLSGALTGKPAAAFTSSGSAHGGQESTLLAMLLPLIHHGMLVVGIPFGGSVLGDTVTGGAPYGAGHIAGGDNRKPISADEKKLAALLGRRVARCAAALAGVNL